MGNPGGRARFRREAIVITIVAAGVAMLAGPAAAAGGGGLGFTASGEALYDSNLLRTAIVSPLNPSARRDDFRYSPTLSATYGRSSGRINLSVNGSLGRDFFQYHRYLAKNRYSGGGTIDYRTGSGCHASVNGFVSQRQNGLRDNTAPLVDVNGLAPDDVGTLIDNVQTSAIYGVNVGCGSPTGKLTFDAGYTRSSSSNASAARRFGDSVSDSYNGSIGLGILRPGQVSLTGSYSTISYPNRALGVPAGVLLPGLLLDAGVKTYRVGISVSRPIGRKLSGSAGISFLHSEPGGVQSPYNAPAYNLGLDYNASTRLNFNLNGSRNSVSSNTAGAAFRVVDQVSLGSHYKLGRAISLDANAGFIRNNYRQAFAIVGETTRFNETTKIFGLGVTYAPRPLYRLSFNVNEAIRNSNPSIFDYSSTRASVTLAVHI